MKRSAAIAHRFLGVIVGVFIAVIGITGSVLLFDKEVNPLLHLQIHQVVPYGERISLQQVALTIQQQYPASQFEWIKIPQTPQEPYHVLTRSQTREKTDVYIHPYRGEILGTYPRDRPIIKYINQLHTHLLAGKFGSFVVGLCGLLLLVLSVTGLMLWNGWKKLSVGFKIRWKAPWRIFHYDLHKVAGVVSVLFLLVIATSGSFMVFDKPIKNFSYWLTGQENIPNPINQLTTNQQPLSLDQFLQIATNVLPKGNPTILHTPKNENSPLRVRFKLPHEVAPEGKSFVLLNQYNGEVLRVENFFKTPAIEQLKAWADALHTGSYGGIFMMIFYIAIGIISAGLSITGFVIWWGRTHTVKPKKAQC